MSVEDHSDAIAGAVRGVAPVAVSSLADLMACVDHTIVVPYQTLDEVAAGIERGLELGVADVVVRPWEVRWARTRIPVGGVTHLSTSIAFPHGDEPAAVKAFAAKQAIEDGADEIDVVMNVAAFRSGEQAYVGDELQQVVGAARGAIVKVILETAYLEPDDVVAAARLAVSAGAAYIKNGTGFSPRGATVEETARIRAAIPATVGVKAAGGIRRLDQALALVAAGASRIGTSSTGDIAQEWRRREQDGETG
jgi:deoxyribose-phosphate aldolase